MPRRVVLHASSAAECAALRSVTQRVRSSAYTHVIQMLATLSSPHCAENSARAKKQAASGSADSNASMS